MPLASGIKQRAGGQAVADGVLQDVVQHGPLRATVLPAAGWPSRRPGDRVEHVEHDLAFQPAQCLGDLRWWLSLAALLVEGPSVQSMLVIADRRLFNFEFWRDCAPAASANSFACIHPPLTLTSNGFMGVPPGGGTPLSALVRAERAGRHPDMERGVGGSLGSGSGEALVAMC